MLLPQWLPLMVRTACYSNNNNDNDNINKHKTGKNPSRDSISEFILTEVLHRQRVRAILQGYKAANGDR